MKLLFATGNQFKKELMIERLKELKEIEVVIPKDLGVSIDVVEDGITPEENACKKAKAYHDVLKMPTIAEDSGLYVDKFSDEEQPGLFVKRVNGREDLSDDEIRAHYIKLLNKYGGESLACYHTGVCLIDSDGNIYTDTIEETKFLFTTNIYINPTKPGRTLEPMSYDVHANKYFAERTEEDIENHMKALNDRYRELVKRHVLKK